MTTSGRRGRAPGYTPALLPPALLDPNARPQRLRRFIPEELPSGREGLHLQF